MTLAQPARVLPVPAQRSAANSPLFSLSANYNGVGPLSVRVFTSASCWTRSSGNIRITAGRRRRLNGIMNPCKASIAAFKLLVCNRVESPSLRTLTSTCRQSYRDLRIVKWAECIYRGYHTASEVERSSQRRSAICSC